MLVRVDDVTLVDDLCAHFLRLGFEAERAGGTMIEARRRDAPSPQQERNEILLHLQLWRALNTGAVVEPVG